MYVTHRTMVIHWCTKYGLTLSKDKKFVARTQSHVENLINLTWRSKGHVVFGSWRLTHVPNIICQCHGKQQLWVGHEPYKFDLEVKCQRRIRIMNVRHSSFHSDTTMSKIWFAYARQELAQTDGKRNLIPMYPLL